MAYSEGRGGGGKGPNGGNFRGDRRGGVALSGLFSGGELLLFGSGSPVNY